jgi:hypothetical protein
MAAEEGDRSLQAAKQMAACGTWQSESLARHAVQVVQEVEQCSTAAHRGMNLCAVASGQLTRPRWLRITPA